MFPGFFFGKWGGVDLGIMVLSLMMLMTVIAGGFEKKGKMLYK